MPELRSLLTYHVVPGIILTDEITDGEKLATVEGSTLSMSIAKNGAISVNGNRLVAGNSLASNGVIHVIDGVLMPPEYNTGERVPTPSPTAEVSMATVVPIEKTEAPTILVGDGTSTNETVVMTESPTESPAASPTEFPAASPTKLLVATDDHLLAADKVVVASLSPAQTPTTTSDCWRVSFLNAIGLMLLVLFTV